MSRSRAACRAFAVAAALAAGIATAVAAGDEWAGWTNVPINADKPRTVYDPMTGEEGAVLRARADHAASMWMKPARGLDLHATPMLEWRWQVRVEPHDADVSVAGAEDAAARLVVVFDGDRAHLPWTDRVVMAAADHLGARPIPFATLMYVTSARHPAGTVVPNPHTRRIQMIVVDGPPPHAPAWHAFSRDVAADYARVFGEAPGPVAAYGVMTDSDNTHSLAEALYTVPHFVARH